MHYGKGLLPERRIPAPRKAAPFGETLWGVQDGGRPKICGIEVYAHPRTDRGRMIVGRSSLRSQDGGRWILSTQREELGRAHVGAPAAVAAVHMVALNVQLKGREALIRERDY
jgi:hypothetical protein